MKRRAVLVTPSGVRSLVGATILFAAAGCAGSSSSVTPTTASPPVMGAAILVPMPAGTATLSRDPRSGRITIAFAVYGMALRSTHAVLLGSGSCVSPGDRVVAVFPDLAVNAYGAMNGYLTSRNKVSTIPAGSHLEIKLAPAAEAISAPGSTQIACADITKANPRTPLTLTPFPGQKPVGTVTLTYFSAGSLEIHIVARGLPPGTTHATYVHFGSCRQQSGVLYTVGDVTSDARGNVDVITTLRGITTPPPAQGWYADLHLVPVSGLEASGKPTLLFQPLLCGDGSR
jgi:hypothetical protein